MAPALSARRAPISPADPSKADAAPVAAPVATSSRAGWRRHPWLWAVLVLLITGVGAVSLDEALDEDEFPNIAEWESMAWVLDEDESAPGYSIVEEAIQFAGLTPEAMRVPIGADDAKLAGRMLEQPTPEGIKELARLRFGHSLRLALAWRDKPAAEALEQAIDSAYSAVTVEDDNPIYWAWLGWLYRIAAHDPLMDALAERALLTALELKPSMPRSRLALAQLYLGRREDLRAIEHFQKLIAMVPAELSATAIAQTAKAYSETGRAAEGATYFTGIKADNRLDPIALRMAQGSLLWLSGDARGGTLLRQVADDPQADPGARKWAATLLDKNALRAEWRAAEPAEMPLDPRFWALIGKAVLTVQDAGLHFDLEIDEALRADSDKLDDASGQGYAELFPARAEARVLAKAHASFYRRAQAEMERLASQFPAEIAETIEPLEETIHDEDNAEDALEAVASVMEHYATLLGALDAYIRFDPGNAARLAGTLGMAPGPRVNETLLDPLRAKLVEWHDYHTRLEAHVADLEAEQERQEAKR